MLIILVFSIMILKDKLSSSEDNVRKTVAIFLGAKVIPPIDAAKAPSERTVNRELINPRPPHY